ncbi:acyl-CoA reductase [Bacteroidota bacterium]
MLRSFTSGLSHGSATDPPSLPEIPLLLKAMEEAETENPWFTRDSVLHALTYWGEMLDQPILETWLDRYHPKISADHASKRVGVIMAGNIPMVGFHDMLSVLLTGNHLVARLSSQDSKLIPAIVNLLLQLEPKWKDQIELTTKEIEKPEAIIATGSNNTSRYFNYYFSRYPHIIRKNRTGVALFDGAETAEDLQGIAADIFTYFGLGCRNVSKLYIPEGYDLKPLHEALLRYQELFHHPKYRNNLDYYKSIYLVNRIRFLDGVFYLLVEAESLNTPVGVLNYEYYTDLQAVESDINKQMNNIQCVVAREGLFQPNHDTGVVLPGKSQNPALSDYADDVDTIEFLLEKI